MIYITGDIHGNPNRFSTNIFPEQKEMTKKDYVIILGDFGLIWDQEESKQERYWLDWLEKKPFTTLFIDGNHENFDRLYSYPVEQWHGGKVHKIRPSVIHLMRGQVFLIEGKKFFTFGGAASHDIKDGILDPDDSEFKAKKRRLDKNLFSLYRINHVSWWKEELPAETEMEEGLDNLRRNDFCVDFVLTHCPPTSILKQMGSYNSDHLTNYLMTVKGMTDYKQWLFGHMHQNKNFFWDHAICIYEQIIRIM